MRQPALDCSNSTLAYMVALALAATTVHGQGLLRLDFEGSEPSWRDAGGDARYTIELQQRVTGSAVAGDWCEHVRLTAGNGTYVYLRHETGAARIIQELRPSVWVKANRPGLQVLARVVLPRTLDARTREPLTTYLRGSTYTGQGGWQRLDFDDLPRALQRQATMLRTRLGPNVDVAEAYLDNILLNIYGGAGTTQVWIDDLEIAGFVGSPGQQPTTPVNAVNWSPASSAPGSAPTASERPSVELDGPVLLVDGKPFFPRMIEHRGEPLEFLKRLGFNTIKLAVLPSQALLAEAEKQQMWIVSPPPKGAVSPANLESAGWHWLLCWDLGENLTNLELEDSRRWTEELGLLDKRLIRPITADVESELRAYSRHVDLLRASRYPLFTSLELADYGTWLRERPKLARPGTTLWTNIQTQPLASHTEQLALLAGQPAQAEVQSEQIRLLVFNAVTAGARGLCFQSQSRLDSQDPAARERAMNLELINLELDLLEPWCAGGTFVDYVAGSEPEVRAAVLQAGHARLLLPLWCGRHSQFVPGQSAGNGITFTVPGVPESCDAYEITPAGIRSIKSLRKTGGMRVTLDEFGLTSMVLLTNDPLALGSMKRKLETSQRRAAQLARDLAAARLAQVEQIDRQLAVATPPLAESEMLLKQAKAAIAQCDSFIHAGAHQLPAAYQHAGRALRPLRLLERAHWERAIKAIRSPLGVASAGSFSTLPQFWDFMRRLQNMELALNALPAGDFEDLTRMMQAGWRHFEHPQPELETEAQVTPSGSHAGQFSLQLRAWQKDDQSPSGLVETPPLWVQSPPVAVEQGQWLRIHGWINVVAPIVGSVDGIMIFDSQTGPALAERIGQTKGWQEFSLYRVAPQSGPLVLTIALTGQGVAKVDDITIEPIVARVAPQAARQPVIQRLPPLR